MWCNIFYNFLQTCCSYFFKTTTASTTATSAPKVVTPFAKAFRPRLDREMKNFKVPKNILKLCPPSRSSCGCFGSCGRCRRERFLTRHTRENKILLSVGTLDWYLSLYKQLYVMRIFSGVFFYSLLVPVIAVWVKHFLKFVDSCVHLSLNKLHVSTFQWQS